MMAEGENSKRGRPSRRARVARGSRGTASGSVMIDEGDDSTRGSRPSRRGRPAKGRANRGGGVAKRHPQLSVHELFKETNDDFAETPCRTKGTCPDGYELVKKLGRKGVAAPISNPYTKDNFVYSEDSEDSIEEVVKVSKKKKIIENQVVLQ